MFLKHELQRLSLCTHRDIEHVLKFREFKEELGKARVRERYFPTESHSAERHFIPSTRC